MTEIDNKIAEDNPNFIHIEHRPSATFLSDFASGAVITGPTLDKLYFLTFYSEAVVIKNEVGKVTQSNIQGSNEGETTYELMMQNAEVESFREDKARILLSRETLISLKDLLNTIKL